MSKSIKHVWSISTIRIWIANNESNEDLLFDVNYLRGFVDDLSHDYSMIKDDFGEDDEFVSRYSLAILEINEWIKKLTNAKTKTSMC